MRTRRFSRRFFLPLLIELEDRTVPTTYTVSSLGGGITPGSLGAAISLANGNAGADTIVFSSLFDTPQTITLMGGELDITGSLTITGPAVGVTISGNSAGRVFNISGTGNIVIGLSDLTITNGQVTGANQGGGILIADESVTLTRCTVSNNTTASAGGGVSVGGGSLTVQDSTFSGNRGSGGGAVYFNGAPLAGGFTVRNSTLSGNSATSNIGGGILLGLGFNGTCKVQNSTLTANSAKGTGGGGIARAQFSTGLINIESSIVSGNLSNGLTGDDISNGGTVAVNFSAIGVGSGFTLSGGNNLAFGANLMLGPLQNNGGPTLTHLPAIDSPLLDKGSNPAGLTFDQRATGYPRSLNALTDIGAVELIRPLVVKNTNDAGMNSLRQAILDANTLGGNDIITFDPNAFASNQSIELISGMISITDALEIVGPGAAFLTIVGNNKSPVYFVDKSNFKVSGLSITGGQGLLNGGGITFYDINRHASLWVDSCVFSGNSAFAKGGAIYFEADSMKIYNSIFQNNTAVDGGGIFAVTEEFLIDSCTINSNSAHRGGGIGLLTDEKTTVTRIQGIINCTISLNSTSDTGGGIFVNDPAVGPADPFFICNSTITNNGASNFGGGVFSENEAIEIYSSVIAKNFAPSGPDIYKAVTTLVLEYSAIGDPNGFTSTGSNNLPFGIDLKLGSLNNNGGSMQTHMPALDSPLINKGTNLGGLLIYDQRGPGFPRVIAGTPDIGAVERIDLIVRNTNDAGPYSLRGVIADAQVVPGPDTITFDPALVSIGDATIGLTTFDTGLDPGELGPTALVISSEMTIIGPTGANGVSVERTAAANFRLFHVTSSGSLTLDNITLKNGNASGFSGGNGTVNGQISGGGGGGSAGMGGAIFNEGTVTIRQCTLMDNQAIGGPGGSKVATGLGGGGGGGGGLGAMGMTSSNQIGASGGGPNGGTQSLPAGVGGGGSGIDYNSIILNGFSGGFGGGGGGGGGAELPNSPRDGGFGGFGGGGGGGGSRPTMVVAFGASGGFGGGIGGGYPNAFGGGGGGGGAGLGGAIFNFGGAITLINSTLSGNKTLGGAGGFGGFNYGTDDDGKPGQGLGGAIFSRNGSVTIRNATFSSNRADQGGGAIFALGNSAAVTIAMDSAILANTLGGASDFASAILFGSRVFTGADNLIETNAGGGNGFTGGIAVAADPLLLLLADNGGPTWTHVLSPISPAINKGSNPAGLANDQRGAGFARVIGAAADIGAVEDTSTTVSGITVNGGDLQRSRITSIGVTFSASLDVTLFQNPGAVTLTRTLGGQGTVVTIGSGLIVIPGAGTTGGITLTFANIVSDGIDSASLGDGYWQLAIPSLGYVSTLNSANLRRLFGDIDANGTVDGAIDFPAFGAQFNTSGANLAFDFNNDGTVDGAVDFPAFGARFNQTL